MIKILSILSDIEIKNLIGIPSNSKLDDTNYDIWHLKVQFTINECDTLDLLVASTPVPADKDEYDKDVIASE